jgi:protoporphyrin/coproporphyrin ferrochelatase
MTEAILLVNMGGPARRNDVEPYLREIFSDPAIIDLPAIIRKPLASLIAMKRKEEVADRYEALGGYSPLFQWSEALRQNIIHELAIRGEQMEVAWAFRYMSPSIEETVIELAHKGVTKLHILPLFPHYTHTMTGSVMKVVEQVATKLNLTYEYLEDWGQEEHVVELWGNYLQTAVAEAGANARVMFVAHGIPQIYVNRPSICPQVPSGWLLFKAKSARLNGPNLTWKTRLRSGPQPMTQS